MIDQEEKVIDNCDDVSQSLLYSNLLNWLHKSVYDDNNEDKDFEALVWLDVEAEASPFPFSFRDYSLQMLLLHISLQISPLFLSMIKHFQPL